jgi:hypothetical protein
LVLANKQDLPDAMSGKEVHRGDRVSCKKDDRKVAFPIGWG